MKKRQSYTIEDLKKYAEDRCGKCLSSVYHNSTTYYDWEDSKGRKWRAKWYHMVLNNRFSPFEGNERRIAKATKYTIKDLQEFALTKGGKCLSTEYTKNKNHYLWEDSKGRQFKMSWMNVCAGQWSTHEKKETLSELNNKYDLNDLKEFAKSKGWELISTEYTGQASYYVWKDQRGKIHERTWQTVKEIVGDRFYNTVSKGHQEIINFLIELGVTDIKINDRQTIKPKELDIYIPAHNLAIEYHGMIWHKEDKNKHIDKFNICKSANINLIQIFEIEWRDRKEQIKSFLRSKLNKNQTVYARKTELRKVDKKEANEFLNKYHIQGQVSHTQAYGLYLNQELLSLITIGFHHRDNKEYVLSRYVGKLGINVVGGLSKLTKQATKDFGEISTWVDLRFSNGENWIKTGWTLVNQLDPDYFYVNTRNGPKQYISKQSRQKNKVNTPDGMTEAEHAKLDGLVRVYDAGKLKLKFSL